MTKITIQAAREKWGMTYQQVRDRIASGEIKAKKESVGGKRGKWMIQPDSFNPDKDLDPKPEDSLDIKMLKMENLQKRNIILDQQSEAGVHRIRKEYEAEAMESALQFVNEFCRLVKETIPKSLYEKFNAKVEKIKKRFGQ